jgi:hypothetical protein
MSRRTWYSQYPRCLTFRHESNCIVYGIHVYENTDRAAVWVGYTKRQVFPGAPPSFGWLQDLLPLFGLASEVWLLDPANPKPVFYTRRGITGSLPDGKPCGISCIETFLLPGPTKSGKVNYGRYLQTDPNAPT